MRLSQPREERELEADGLAREVLTGGVSAARASGPPGDAHTVHRACAGCAREEVARAPARGGGPAYASERDSARIARLGSGARPLDGAARAYFEPRFGADLSGVRVRTDGEAQQLSANLSARAFTYGRTIAFGQGQYAPNSDPGRKLLAHELAHVVRGDAGARVQRAPATPTPEEGRPWPPIWWVRDPTARQLYAWSKAGATLPDVARFLYGTEDAAAKLAAKNGRADADPLLPGTELALTGEQLSPQATQHRSLSPLLPRGVRDPEAFLRRKQELDVALLIDFASVVRVLDESHYSDSDEAFVYSILHRWATESFTLRPDLYPAGGDYLDELFKKLKARSKKTGWLIRQNSDYYSQIFEHFDSVQKVRELRDRYSRLFRGDEGVVEARLLGERPVPLLPEDDPCRIDVETLTNVHLLRSIERTTWRTNDREDYYYFDFMNLLNRLVKEKVRRINSGHRWMAEPGVTELPLRLLRLASSDSTLTTVTMADADAERGLPQDPGGVILSDRQFVELLAEHDVPIVDVASLYASGQYSPEEPLQMHFRRPEPEPQPPVPYFLTGLHTGTPVLSSVAGSGITAPIEQMAMSNTLGRRWAEPQMRGFLLEDFLHYGTWKGRLGYTDLNRIRPSGQYVMDPFHGGTNFPVFDAAGRWGNTEIVSVAYSGQRNEQGGVKGDYYREKFRRMTGDFSERETAKLGLARGRLGRLTGEPFSISATPGPEQIDLLGRTLLAVPDDHVDAVRASIHEDVRAHPERYERFFDHVLREQPAQAGPGSLVRYETVRRALERTSGPGPRLTQGEYDSIVGRVADAAASRVLGAGATEAELVALSSTRAQASALDRRQFGVVASEQAMAARVLVAQGMHPDLARHTVALRSARTGMLMSGGVTGGIELARLVGTGEGDPRQWARAGAGVVLNAGGGFVEEYAGARMSMFVSERALGASSAPGLTTSGARLTTLGAAGGQAVARMGPTVVLAPLISRATMSVEESLGLAQYHEFEEQSRMKRDTATAAVGAGSALATAGLFALAGSEVPLVGNVVGFFVGLGAALLFDVTVGESIEKASMESLGAQGCVGGRARPTSD